MGRRRLFALKVAALSMIGLLFASLHLNITLSSVRRGYDVKIAEASLIVQVWRFPFDSIHVYGEMVYPRVAIFPWVFREPDYMMRKIQVPLWVPVAYLVYRRSQQEQRGRCRQCNYDLRGITADVCPECGNRMRAASVATRPAEVADHRESSAVS